VKFGVRIAESPVGERDALASRYWPAVDRTSRRRAANLARSDRRPRTQRTTATAFPRKLATRYQLLSTKLSKIKAAHLSAPHANVADCGKKSSCRNGHPSFGRTDIRPLLYRASGDERPAGKNAYAKAQGRKGKKERRKEIEPQMDADKRGLFIAAISIFAPIRVIRGQSFSFRAYRGYPSSLLRLLLAIKWLILPWAQDRKFILEKMLDIRCQVAKMGDLFMLPKGDAGVHAIVVSGPATWFGE